jgi:3-oxoadipate enol-lactonase
VIHTISIITKRGNTLSIKACGNSGPALFLLHGFPLDHRMWLNQIEPLGERYRVIVPELRGFGQSTVDSDYSLADLAEDVEQVRQHLAAREQIHLVGLSMGGYVCFEYWHAYTMNLKSLVLANTKPSADDETAKQGRFAMAAKALEQGTWPAVAPMMDRLIGANCRGSAVETTMREMMESASPQAVAAAQRAMAERRDFTPMLPSIAIPTLIITGQHDVIAPPEPTQAWASQIPNSRYVELPDAGHMTTMESPEQFNQALIDFIR